MNSNFNTKIIDPQKANLSENVVIQKVYSEIERLPNHEHEKAVKAFYFSDSIASGIGKDLAFVDKIPQLINEIIENKSWKCLYVSKGVTTPYYCRYVRGTESENFKAFITAKRPNGLETTVETLDRVLKANSEIHRKFRTIIYESRQGERTDLIDQTSGSHCLKFDLSERQRKNLRAANRAAEAIPEVIELLDRGLIAIDIAAKLGREIKDPDNLTAEEREYVDKRDLVGIRIREYIYTNPIPEDEDKEPAYSRELNRFVKDLLGIKDRSKSIRMDHPKKAAQKILQFYEGEKLSELINLLKQGLEQLEEKLEVREDKGYTTRSSQTSNSTDIPVQTTSQHINIDHLTHKEQNLDVRDEYKAATEKKITEYTASSESKDTDSPIEILEVVDTKTDDRFYNNTENGLKQIDYVDNTESSFKNNENTVCVHSTKQEDSDSLNSCNSSPAENQAKDNTEADFSLHISPKMQYTLNELAERLGKNPQTVTNMACRQSKNKFVEWSQKLDPDGVAWQRKGKRPLKGEPLLFIPFTETVLEEINQQENSDVIENGI